MGIVSRAKNRVERKPLERVATQCARCGTRSESRAEAGGCLLARI